jgi:hypothetical protein
MPAVVGEHDEDEEDAQAGGGHGEEIDRDQVPGMVGEERPPSLGGRRFGISRDTVRSATSRPSFRISPWMRGAPQRAFAVAIFLTRALSSGVTGGRPPVVRPESRVQYARKRRHCHLRTVAGVTITSGCVQPARLWPARPRRVDPFGGVGAGLLSSYRRRVAGARPGSRGRAGDGRRRGKGGAGAGGVGP